MGGASQPTVFVIYGASGDLSQRKLLPAIYNPPSAASCNRFAVIGYSRSEMDTRPPRIRRTAVEKFSRTPVDDRLWRAFAQTSLPGWQLRRGGVKGLGRRLEAIDAAHRTGGNRVYYLLTPASFFPVMVQSMGATKLNKPPGFARVVIEKPFGHDLASARELADVVHRPFSESQIFRIDHYLGKETVQNIFAFPFANTIFKPVWNNTHVDHVQLTVGESIGVEHRAAFYEETGVIRDIVQNHLLQVFALVAMEPPAAFDADPIRDEKAKLLRATRPMTLENSVRGQYGEGTRRRAGRGVPRGAERPARRTRRPTSRRSSRSTTGAGPGRPSASGPGNACQAGDRGRGAVQSPAAPAFPTNAVEQLEANALVLRIQPTRGVTPLRRKGANADAGAQDRQHGLPVRVVVPGRVPEAYETLNLDAMRGDGTLFTRQDSVERSWTGRSAPRAVAEGDAAGVRLGLVGAGPRRQLLAGRPPVAQAMSVNGETGDLAAVESMLRAARGSDRRGSVRAITLNLVVHAPDSERIESAMEALEHVGPSHPLRAIVATPADGELRASVASSCWVGASDRQVCSERVLVTASCRRSRAP